MLKTLRNLVSACFSTFGFGALGRQVTLFCPVSCVEVRFDLRCVLFPCDFVDHNLGRVVLFW
jgi:hypothetical protein